MKATLDEKRWKLFDLQLFGCYPEKRGGDVLVGRYFLYEKLKQTPDNELSIKYGAVEIVRFLIGTMSRLMLDHH